MEVKPVNVVLVHTTKSFIYVMSTIQPQHHNPTLFTRSECFATRTTRRYRSPLSKICNKILIANTR